MGRMGKNNHALKDVALVLICKLSVEEWNFQSNFYWGSKTIHGKYPVTIKSLFDYKYKDESHEGGHAKQIGEYFDRDYSFYL